jgi:RNA polymerase sigma-70 factor (ECF subfamily)
MVHNHDDADDVLQNTFIKVYKGISQFEGKSKLYTWMYRIATNEALTFLKSSSRHAHKPLEDWNSSGSQADTWMDADEVQRKLQLAIDELPEKQKVVFLLRYHDEMPYEEMSEVLNTSVGALKASFHHAVRKIEQIVREWE